MRLKIIRAAQNLSKRGYVKGNIFSCVARNSHNLAPILFATMGIGCAMNSLEPSFKKPELLHMLQITKPSAMFCDIEAFNLVKECLLELRNNAHIFTFGGSKDGSEDVENLFLETHNENKFE